MKKIILLFLISISSFRIYAQSNLVINPGFEIVSSIPSTYGEINKAIGWKSPNTVWSELCSELAIQPYVSAPLGNLGYFYQYPRTGNNFAGILTLRTDYDPNIRAYIQGKLSDTLRKKQKYIVEYYVNLANGSVYTTNNLGVYFSNDSFYIQSYYSLLDTPQVVNMASNLLNDTLNWIKVSGTYTAKGGEKYLTIGCFSAALGLDTLLISNQVPCLHCHEAYYNIDDVSVTLDDTNSGVNNLYLKGKINVHPNPASDLFYIDVEGEPNFKGLLEVFDILGKLVFAINLNSTHTEISASILNNGVYYLRIKQGEQIVNQGKLVITK